MNEKRINAQSRVTLHFAVRLAEGGELVDSTYERPEPASFAMGDGSLLPGFEKAIMGLKAGDRRSVLLTPEQAFGPWNPDNVQRLPRPEFHAVEGLVPGLMISFADKAKAELPGVVKAVTDDLVEVDFNHPLAGRELLFEVDIVRVDDADAAVVRLA